MEWVSILVERASGSRMEEYLQENICRPLGLHSTAIFPSPDMRRRLTKQSYRSLVDGTIRDGDQFFQSMLEITNQSEKDATFQNGAGGVYSTPVEFCSTS